MLLISVTSVDEDLDNRIRAGFWRLVPFYGRQTLTYLFIYVFLFFFSPGMSFLSEGHNVEYQRDLHDVFHMLRTKHGENVLVSELPVLNTDRSG